MVFFLMCEIPSPSLLFAITLWKAGNGLLFLSYLHACICEPRQHYLAICTGRVVFFFFYFPNSKKSVVAFVLETKTLLKNYMTSANRSAQNRSCALG